MYYKRKFRKLTLKPKLICSTFSFMIIYCLLFTSYVDLSKALLRLFSTKNEANQASASETRTTS